MKIQVALDFSDMNELIKVTEKVKDYVDIFECGTPLIFRYGAQCVTDLKNRYPDKEILCDGKIMDGGYFFGTEAAKWKADIFTVMGVAEDETVQGAVNAAKDNHIKVMVDMCSVTNYVERAKQIKEWGADYICIHTPTDIQTKENHSNRIGEIAEVIGKEFCAVAGGVDPLICEYLKDIQPEVVVAGSYITKAADPAQAAKAIREAIQ